MKRYLLTRLLSTPTTLLLAVILTGCVTSHHPVVESDYEVYAEDGAYDGYAEAYDDGYGNYSGSYTTHIVYSDAAWYPWWSMDYFYFGNHHYRPSRGSAFTFGMSFGYPYYGPWYYPHYYSGWYGPYAWHPWYRPHYAWGGWYGGYHPYWPSYRHAYYNRGYGATGRRAPPPAGSRGGLATGGEYRGGLDRGGRDLDGMSRDRQRSRPDQPVATQRRVSVAPSSGGRDRGMVIVSGSENKVGPNRTQPTRPQPGQQPTQQPTQQPAPGAVVAPVNTRPVSTPRVQPRGATRPVPSAPAAAPAYTPPSRPEPSSGSYRSPRMSTRGNSGRARGSDRTRDD